MSRPDDLSGGYAPVDLAPTGKTIINKAYLDLPFSNLELGTKYNFQFSYVDLDGNESSPSPVFSVTTSTISSIQKPKFTSGDLTYTTNTLLVSWNGKDYLNQDYDKRFARIDIYAKGGSFGETYKVVGQFLKAGTQTITSLAGQYWVKLQAVTVTGLTSDFSDEQTIITESPIVVDTDPPPNPSGVTVSYGVDPKDQTGFSAYATFSWTHHTNAATNGTRGYRIRWTYDTTNPIYEYGFVDYPNNSYTATGLIPNIQYTYQVASVDQFNNTQSYYTGGTFTATDPTNPDGWARLKSYLSIGGVTGDLFKFGTGISSSINTSLTTTPSLTSGNYNGIILNKTGNNNNFWLTTGQFRVGGNTQFMYWDGTNLSITGDLGVGGGATIAGNLFMKTSGASIYSGSLTAGALAVGTAGYILNNDGLLVQNNETGTNRKYVRIDPATGTLFANNAQITGSLVITGGATKTAIDNAQADATAASSAASAASAAAASKAKVFRDASYSTSNKPTPSAIGDIWIDVNDYNKMYVASTTSNTGWVLSQDSNSKLDSGSFTKSEIIKKINDNNNGAGIEGSVIYGSAIISNNVLAGERGIRGDTFTQYGSIFDLDNGTISTPNFKINSAGNAEFKGTITSSTVTGGTIRTSTGNNRIEISGSDDSIRFYSPAGGTPGRIYGDVYNINGSFGLMQIVGAAATGHTSPIITLYSYGNSSTNSDYGVNFYGGVAGVSNVGLSQRVFRNISAGTGSKTSTDTDGLLGDIWIQYA